MFSKLNYFCKKFVQQSLNIHKIRFDHVSVYLRVALVCLLWEEYLYEASINWGEFNMSV